MYMCVEREGDLRVGDCPGVDGMFTVSVYNLASGILGSVFGTQV